MGADHIDQYFRELSSCVFIPLVLMFSGLPDPRYPDPIQCPVTESVTEQLRSSTLHSCIRQPKTATVCIVTAEYDM